MDDALRRALAEADAAHRDAMPRYRELLKHTFSPALTRADRAAILGVPDAGRRRFLRSGGLAAAGAIAAASLAACSDDGAPTGDEALPDASGTVGTGDGNGGGAGPNAGDVDLTTAAIQIEHTAVAAYTAITEARGADLQATGLAETALLFLDHHREHAGALNGLLSDNGLATIGEDQRFAGITLPDADTIGSLSVTELADLARGLEDRAAQTYITAVPRLSIPALRQTLMSIGAVEARHVGAYDLLLGGGPGGYAATAQPVVGGSYPTDDSFLNG